MSDCLNCNPCAPYLIGQGPALPVAIVCDTTSGGGGTVIDTEPVCLTDSSGTQFFGVLQFDESGTFIGMEFYTVDQSGALIPYAPTSAPVPCNVEDIEEVSDCYIAIAAGVGYDIGDQITVTRWYDTSNNPPTLLSTVFYNKTTLTPILAVPAVDLTACFANDVETEQVLCDIDPVTGELLGRAWFELHFDVEGDLANTILAGVHFDNPTVVERPFVPQGSLGDCSNHLTEYNVCFEENVNPGVVLRGIVYTRINPFINTEISVFYVDELGNQYLGADVTRVECPIPEIVAYEQCWNSNENSEFCPTNIGGFTQDNPGSNCAITIVGVTGFFAWAIPVTNLSFYYSGSDGGVFILNSPSLGGIQGLLANQFGITGIGIANAVTGTFTATMNGILVTLIVQDGGVYNDGAGNLTVVDGTVIYLEFESTLANLQISFSALVPGTTNFSTFRTYNNDEDGNTYHQTVFTDGRQVWFDRFGNLVDQPNIILTECEQERLVAYHQCWQSEPFIENCPDNFGGFAPNPDNCSLIANNINGIIQYLNPIENLQFNTTGDNATLIGLISSPTLGGPISQLANLFGITVLTPANAITGTFTAVVLGVTITLTVFGDGGVYDDGAGNLAFINNTNFWFSFSTPIIQPITINFANSGGGGTPTELTNFISYVEGEPVTYHQTVFTDGTDLWFDADGDLIDQPGLILTHCETQLEQIAFEQCWESNNFVETCPDVVDAGFTPTPNNCNLIANGGAPQLFRFNGPIDNIGFHVFDTLSPANVLSQMGGLETGGIIPLLATIFGVTAVTPATAQTGTFTGVLGGVNVTMVVSDTGGVFNGGGNLIFLDHTTFHFTFGVDITNLEFVFTVPAGTTIDTFIRYIPGNDIIFHQVVYENGEVVWFDQNGNIIDEPHILLQPCGGCEIEPVISNLCYTEDVAGFQATSTILNNTSIPGFVGQLVLQINAGPIFNFNYATLIRFDQFTPEDVRLALDSIIETNGLDIIITNVHVSPRPNGFDLYVTGYGDDIPVGFNVLVNGPDLSSFAGAAAPFLNTVKTIIRQFQYINCDGDVDFTRYFNSAGEEITDTAIIDELEPCEDCGIIDTLDYCITRDFPLNVVGNWNLTDPNTATIVMSDGLINYNVTITKDTTSIIFIPLGGLLQLGFTDTLEHEIVVSIDPPFNGNAGFGLVNFDVVPTEYLTDFNLGIPTIQQQPLYLDANDQLKTLATVAGALRFGWTNVQLIDTIRFNIAGSPGNQIGLLNLFSRYLGTTTWKKVVYCDGSFKYVDAYGYFTSVLPLGYSEIDCADCELAKKVEICNFTRFNQENLCYIIPRTVTRTIMADNQTLQFVEMDDCNTIQFPIVTTPTYQVGGLEVNDDQDEIYLIGRRDPEHILYTYDFSGSQQAIVNVTGLNSVNENIQALERNPLTNEYWVLTKENAIPDGHLYTLDIVTGVLTFRGTITGGSFIQEDTISLLIDEYGNFYVTWFQATSVIPLTDTQLSQIDPVTFAYIGEKFDFTLSNAGAGGTWSGANTVFNFFANFVREYDDEGNVIRECAIPVLTNNPGLASITDYQQAQTGSFNRVYEIINDVIQSYRDYDQNGQILDLPSNVIVANCEDIQRLTDVLCDESGQFVRHSIFLNNELIDFYDADFYNQRHYIVGTLRSCNELPALIDCNRSGSECSTAIINQTTNQNNDFIVNVNEVLPNVWELIFAGDPTDLNNFANLFFSLQVNNQIFINLGIAGNYISSVSVTGYGFVGPDFVVTIDFNIIPNETLCISQLGSNSWESIYQTWLTELNNVVIWPLTIPTNSVLFYTGFITGDDTIVEALPVAIVCNNFPDREIQRYCYRAIVDGNGYNEGDVLYFNVLVDTNNITSPPYINFQNVSQNLNVLWQLTEGVSIGNPPNFADFVPCEAYGGTLPDLVDCNDNCTGQTFANIGVRSADITVNVTNVGLIWTFEFLGVPADVDDIKPNIAVLGDPNGFWQLDCFLGFDLGINASLITVLVDNPGQYIIEVDFTNIPTSPCSAMPNQQSVQTGLFTELANSGNTWTLTPACEESSTLLTQVGEPVLAMPVAIVCGDIEVETVSQDGEALILCDDNGSFIRHLIYEAGVVINTFDTELDGLTPYVPVGAVVNCGAEDATIQPIVEGALLAVPAVGATLYTFTNPVQSVSIGNVDGGILEVTFVTNPVSASNNLQYVMPGGTLQVGFGDNIEIISINILNSGNLNITVLVNGVTPGRN